MLGEIRHSNRIIISNIDMDASTQTCRYPIHSLSSLVLDYVVENLNLYVDIEEKISILPFNIKNRILQRFTTSAHFWRKVDFPAVLCILVNEQTQCLNLTAADVDDIVLKIISRCKNVKKLYLSRTKDIHISRTALLTLLQNCHKLIHLLLARSTEVDDIVLECIAENCPNLMGLDIGGSTYVTDVGIKKLSKLKNLSWVTFSSTQITDEGIIHFVQGESRLKLKELRIENTKVTDIGLMQISQNCPNLEVLSFYNSQKRDDLSCPTFSNDLKNLKQLTWTVNW